jgi:hypothetical protein
VVGRSRERGGGVYILDVESEEMSDGLSGTIFSITSIVLAGETGRLSGIGSRGVLRTPLASREGVLLE